MSEQAGDDLTPVDDVRKARKEIEDKCGGDIRKIAAYVNEVGESLQEKLGLRPIDPPTRFDRESKAV